MIEKTECAKRIRKARKSYRKSEFLYRNAHDL